MVLPEGCPKCEQSDCIESVAILSDAFDKSDNHKKEWSCTKCGYSFDDDEATFWYENSNLSMMTISQIADIIFSDWHDMSHYARPYADVLRNVDNISDKYESEEAADIVSYFLANAQHWKGETAERIKVHLKKLVEDYRKLIEAELFSET